MLHTNLQSKHITGDEVNPSRTNEVERRRCRRLECHADVVLAWNHALDHRVRLGVCDISEDGMRVRSSQPIMTDLTGVAISLLPEGIALNRVVRVVWVERQADATYIAGLQFLS